MRRKLLLVLLLLAAAPGCRVIAAAAVVAGEFAIESALDRDDGCRCEHDRRRERRCR
jgi:hypothetical protein